MYNEENNELSEPVVTDSKKRINFFSSFEEMNESDAKENAAISSVTHLENAFELTKRTYSNDLQKPMDKTVKFKDVDLH